jgi:hypothetical protein
MHLTPAPTVRRHDGTLHEDDRGALMKGFGIPPEGLGCKITHLPFCLQGVHLDTTGLTPASQAFRRELQLPCDLLFGTPHSLPDKE